MIETIQLEDKEITFIGTAHVSKKSADLVSETITTLKPDSVCIELCSKRFAIFENKEAWRQVDIFRIIKEKKSAFVLAELILSSFYKRIGDAIGVEPGAEFRSAIQAARQENAQIILSDRALEITLKRLWRSLSFFQKVKALSSLMSALFSNEEFSEEAIEKMKEEGELESALESFSNAFPEGKKSLIDERDLYLAEKIRNAPGTKIVAVIGAGHLQGILKHIHKEIDIRPLEKVPAPSLFGKLIKWIIPATILLLGFFLFMQQGEKAAIESLWIWIGTHALFSLIGALLAFAHPLAALAGALMSPLTSLNPLLAAGWFAGLVQAFLMKPTVGDLERLSKETQSFSGFWKNRLARVLLVVTLTNLGSSLATFVSGAWIFSSLL